MNNMVGRPYIIVICNRKSCVHNRDPSTCGLDRIGININGCTRYESRTATQPADQREAAFFEGWKAGAATGVSDSPDWNAGEDWAESDARKRLLTATRHDDTEKTT